MLRRCLENQKQFCHKEIPSTATLTVVCCSHYMLSEKNTGMRKRAKEGRAALIKDMELSLFNKR